MKIVVVGWGRLSNLIGIIGRRVVNERIFVIIKI